MLADLEDTVASTVLSSVGDMTVPDNLGPCAVHPAFLEEADRNKATSFQLLIVKLTSDCDAGLAGRCVPALLLSVWRNGVSRGKIQPSLSAFEVKMNHVFCFRGVLLEIVWEEGSLGLKATKWSDTQLWVAEAVVCQYFATDVGGFFFPDSSPKEVSEIFPNMRRVWMLPILIVVAGAVFLIFMEP